MILLNKTRKCSFGTTARQNQSPEGPFETAVIGLINDIYKDFPPNAHPKLVWLLVNTFQTELASAKQRSNGFSSETLKLTVGKGAFSTSAFAYIGRQGMSEKEFGFFYKAGALF